MDGTRGTNSASSVPGVVRRAFGTHSFAYVQIPDAPVYRVTNGVTIEAWVNYGGQNAVDGYQTILAKWDAANRNPPGSTNISYDLSVDYLGRAYFIVSTTGRDSGVLVSSNGPPVNQWTYLAATYDGSALRIYINGVLDCQTNYPGTLNPAVMDLGIGGDPGSDGSMVSFFHGAIDEPSLYNRALTPGEILSIYLAGSAGKCRVYPSPFITSQPVGQTVYAGDTVTFSVVATGEPPLAYQWKFNNTVLPAATNTSLVDGPEAGALGGDPGGGQTVEKSRFTIPESLHLGNPPRQSAQVHAQLPGRQLPAPVADPMNNERLRIFLRSDPLHVWRSYVV